MADVDGDTGRHRFTDADGDEWEIRTVRDFKWEFVPAEEDDRIRRVATPPPGVDRPPQMTEDDLQRLLESGIPAGDAG